MEEISPFVAVSNFSKSNQGNSVKSEVQKTHKEYWIAKKLGNTPGENIVPIYQYDIWKTTQEND